MVRRARTPPYLGQDFRPAAAPKGYLAPHVGRLFPDSAKSEHVSCVSVELDLGTMNPRGPGTPEPGSNGSTGDVMFEDLWHAWRPSVAPPRRRGGAGRARQLVRDRHHRPAGPAVPRRRAHVPSVRAAAHLVHGGRRVPRNRYGTHPRFAPQHRAPRRYEASPV